MAPSEHKLLKKANKFTRVFVKQLQKDEWTGKRKKLKKIFKHAIEQLPQEELRTVLQADFPKYLATVKENIVGQKSSEVIQEVKSNGQPTEAKKSRKKKTKDSLPPTLAKKRKIVDVQMYESFPYNLYLNERRIAKDVLSEEKHNEAARCLIGQTITTLGPKKLDKLLKTITDESGDWARSTHMLCEMVTGTRSQAALRHAMLHLNRVLTKQGNAILQLNAAKLKAAQETLKKFLMFFHYQWSKLEEVFVNPPYPDLISALLSFYADIIVILSRTLDTDQKETLVRHLLLISSQFVSCEYLYDIILQQTVVESDDTEALLPFWRTALLTPRNVTTCLGYTKYMCAMKVILSHLEGQVKDEFITMALSVMAPTEYMSWLHDLDSTVLDETPLTGTSSGGAITRYLVEEADESLMESLLNLLTMDSDVYEQGVLSVSSSDQSTVASPDAAPLFFFDKTATVSDQTRDIWPQESEDFDDRGYNLADVDLELTFAGDDSNSGNQETQSKDKDRQGEDETEQSDEEKTDEEDDLAKLDAENDTLKADEEDDPTNSYGEDDATTADGEDDATTADGKDDATTADEKDDATKADVEDDTTKAADDSATSDGEDDSDEEDYIKAEIKNCDVTKGDSKPDGEDHIAKADAKENTTDYCKDKQDRKGNEAQDEEVVDEEQCASDDSEKDLGIPGLLIEPKPVIEFKSPLVVVDVAAEVCDSFDGDSSDDDVCIVQNTLKGSPHGASHGTKTTRRSTTGSDDGPQALSIVKFPLGFGKISSLVTETTHRPRRTRVLVISSSSEPDDESVIETQLTKLKEAELEMSPAKRMRGRGQAIMKASQQLKVLETAKTMTLTDAETPHERPISQNIVLSHVSPTGRLPLKTKQSPKFNDSSMACASTPPKSNQLPMKKSPPKSMPVVVNASLLLNYLPVVRLSPMDNISAAQRTASPRLNKSPTAKASPKVTSPKEDGFKCTTIVSPRLRRDGSRVSPAVMEISPRPMRKLVSDSPEVSMPLDTREEKLRSPKCTATTSKSIKSPKSIRETLPSKPVALSLRRLRSDNLTNQDSYNPSDVQSPLSRNLRKNQEEGEDIKDGRALNKTCIAQNGSETIVAQRRSRRLSISSNASSVAEQESEAPAGVNWQKKQLRSTTGLSASSTISSPHTPAMIQKTPRQATPFATQSVKRRSLAPMLREVEEGTPLTSVTLKRKLSAEKKKPLTRRRSTLLSQLSQTIRTKSPVKTGK